MKAAVDDVEDVVPLDTDILKEPVGQALELLAGMTGLLRSCPAVKKSVHRISPSLPCLFHRGSGGILLVVSSASLILTSACNVTETCSGDEFLVISDICWE